MELNRIQHIAVIGLGSIGRRHVRILKRLRPELEITLVRSGKGQTWPEEHRPKRGKDFCWSSSGRGASCNCFLTGSVSCLSNAGVA